MLGELTDTNHFRTTFAASRGFLRILHEAVLLRKSRHRRYSQRYGHSVHMLLKAKISMMYSILMNYVSSTLFKSMYCVSGTHDTTFACMLYVFRINTGSRREWHPHNRRVKMPMRVDRSGPRQPPPPVQGAVVHPAGWNLTPAVLESSTLPRRFGCPGLGARHADVTAKAQYAARACDVS